MWHNCQIFSFLYMFFVCTDSWIWGGCNQFRSVFEPYRCYFSYAQNQFKLINIFACLICLYLLAFLTRSCIFSNHNEYILAEKVALAVKVAHRLQLVDLHRTGMTTKIFLRHFATW